MTTITDKTLTAANSVLKVKAQGFIDNYVTQQGYAADNMFDMGNATIGETVMGADGFLSGAFTPYKVTMNIQLMANSPSIPFWDALVNKMDTDKETFPISLICEIPSIKKRYTASGFLVAAPGGVVARKILESVTYTLDLVIDSREDI